MLFLRYYLWIFPHVLLAIVAIGAFRRRLYQQLPVFCAYAVFELIQFLVLFGVVRFLTHSSLHIYVWFLTCGDLVNALFQVGVLYELVQIVILSHASLERVLRPIFTGALAVLLVGSAISSGVLHDVSRERIVNGFEVMDFSSNLILAGMLVVIIVFSRALHISWRSRATGVALGFGILACIDLATAAIRSGFGDSTFVAMDIAKMAAFHVAVVIWLIYLFFPDRKLAFAGRGLAESDIQFWDDQLQRMAQQ